jgi:fatty-acyl-CoA synthase
VIAKKGETVTPEDIMEHCRANLASFKRPRSVYFVDELPRNPMGKILKKQLREEYSGS